MLPTLLQRYNKRELYTSCAGRNRQYQNSGCTEEKKVRIDRALRAGRHIEIEGARPVQMFPFQQNTRSKNTYQSTHDPRTKRVGEIKTKT